MLFEAESARGVLGDRSELRAPVSRSGNRTGGDMINRTADRTIGKCALALSLALAAGAAAAQPGTFANPAQQGYATSSGGVVRSGFGLCWHTGSWSPEKAVAPCDALPRVKAPLPPVAAPEPKPALRLEPKIAAQPQPVPAPKPKPRAPVIERVSLDTELLFDFDRAVLRRAGRAKLEEIAVKLHGARIDSIEAIGHADRIASHSYNQELSEARAQAVKAFLSKLGLDPRSIHAEGHGETEPVTGERCDGLGPEHKENLKLIACLQPDRRVEVEVLGAMGGSQP
jgi:OOP family OmpA-OmpF porin